MPFFFILSKISTESSIHVGVIQGLTFEMDGFIDAYREKYQELTVILTGGDVFYFEKSLKYDIFASENLLLNGLNYILDYNEL